MASRAKKKRTETTKTKPATITCRTDETTTVSNVTWADKKRENPQSPSHHNNASPLEIEEMQEILRKLARTQGGDKDDALQLIEHLWFDIYDFVEKNAKKTVCTKLLECQGVPILLLALHKYQQYEDFVEDTIQIFFYMTCAVKESTEALAKIYAVDVIITIAKQYPGSRLISRCTVGILSAFTKSNDFRGFAATEECIDFVTSAMKKYREDKDLLQYGCDFYGCDFIDNVSSIPEKKEQLLAKKCMSLVVDVFENADNNSRLKEKAKSTLAKLL